MKHLKKLSVVLLLTALFSVTFTSCIDDEVSPAVEAIYAAQADLITAQVAVQNAEAAKLEAEAAYELALAAMANADAAFTLQEVEELRIENANAQLDLDLATAEFNITMVDLLAQLDEAGAQVALDYALKYRAYANAANDLLIDKADAVYDLALAQAQADANYPLYAVEGLEMQVANAEYQVGIEQAKIDALQALIDDPNSLPAQVTAWEAERADLAITRDLKQAELDAKTAERDNLIAGSNGEDAVRDAFVLEYEGYVADSLAMSNAIKAYQDDIDDWSAALATYAVDLANAETAVDNAINAYDDAWTALGLTDGADTDIFIANYFMVDANGGAIAIGAAKYSPATNSQEEYVNARIDVLDATAELAAYQADFDALVSTYNTAANNLNAAQIAFDSANYAGDLTTAQAAVTTSLAVGGDYNNAKKAYVDAKTAFEADPSGSVTTDGDGNHSNAFFPASPNDFDLGNTGIHTDMSPLTYMRVATWKETTLGSGNYVPASFYPTKYNTADLAVEAAALIADAGNTIATNADIWLWEDAAATMPINDIDANVIYADSQFLLGPDAIKADTEDIAVFVNVESDDSSVSKLFTFNVATNMLGTNNFSARPFFTSGTGTVGDPYTFNATLTFGDTDAGYDNTWDGNTSNPQTDNTLTAEAALWNLKLAEFIAQNNFDLGDDLLAAAQDAFDYQKELFDNGVANLAILQGDLDDATTAEADAQTTVDNAWLELGVEYILPTTYTGQLPKYWVVDATHSAANFDIDPTSEDGAGALTLNAVAYNSTVALLKLEDCDEVCLQGKIDVAQHEIDLIQPSLDFRLAKIAEMQAQYDIYMATYIPGSSVNYANLDADLKVEYDTLSFEIFELRQELYALDAQYDYLSDMILFGGDNLSDVAGQLGSALTLASGDYQLALDDLETAENALAAAKASVDYDAEYLVYLQAEVDVLQQRYDNAKALADKYKALMDAALAS